MFIFNEDKNRIVNILRNKSTKNSLRKLQKKRKIIWKLVNDN
jgi:hypothetical protein